MDHHATPAPARAARTPAAGIQPEESPAGSLGTLEREAPDRPWRVLVWNDPVNLMSYVTYVFRSYFRYPEATAHALMMAVHEEGRAVVYTGGREEAERHTAALHGYGLWATYEQEAS